MVNAAGWDLLFNGSMVNAAYAMYDAALPASYSGWFILMLFFTFHVLAWLKTKKVESAFFIGVIFFAMYMGGKYGTAFILPGWIIPIMIIVLVFEIGVMIYQYTMK